MTNFYNIKQRPNLTERYPAVDGIRKQDLQLSGENCMGQHTVVYNGGEHPIRPDVLDILNKTRADFDRWYFPIMGVIKDRLHQLEVVSSIPDLSIGSRGSTYGDYTCIKGELEVLKEAKEDMQMIWKLWAENQHQ